MPGVVLVFNGEVLLRTHFCFILFEGLHHSSIFTIDCLWEEEMKLILKTKIGKEESRRCLAGKRLEKILSQGWQLWTWTLAITTDQLLPAWRCPCHSLWNHIHKDNLGSGCCLCYSSNTSTGILRSLKFSINVQMEGLQDLRTACYFTSKYQFIIW